MLGFILFFQMVPRSMFRVIGEAWLISWCAFPVRHVNDIHLVLSWIHGERGCDCTQWFSTERACLVIADLPWGQAVMILQFNKCQHINHYYTLWSVWYPSLTTCLKYIQYPQCWSTSVWIKAVYVNTDAEYRVWLKSEHDSTLYIPWPASCPNVGHPLHPFVSRNSCWFSTRM